MIEHFSHVRKTLVAMYEASKSAHHSVVTGTLREGFARGVLKSHLPSTTVWSTGELIGYAPSCDRSGQLDLILHSGELPQFDIFDSYIRVVPAEATIAVVEVKSSLTTGKDSTETLTGALESLVLAKNIQRIVAVRKSPVPFFILAFHSPALPETIIKHVNTFLRKRSLQPSIFWPEGIVVLSGGKTYPNGYGIFRAACPVEYPKNALSKITDDISLSNAVTGFKHTGIHVFETNGDETLSVFVAAMANTALGFQPSNFRLERYLYETEEVFS